MDRKAVPGTQCVRFYLCVFNKLNVLSCPAGLLFDEVKGKCDYEKLVDCKLKTTTNIITSTKSKLTNYFY